MKQCIATMLLLIVVMAFPDGMDGAEGYRVAPAKRHLLDPNGKPFFWLGDTAWAICHALDRPDTETKRAVWDAVAKGVAQAAVGSEDYSKVLMTYHSPGRTSSSQWLHSKPWLDFNMIQTWSAYTQIHSRITHDYHLSPVKPTGLGVEVRMDKLAGDSIRAAWVDPKTGKRIPMGENAKPGTRSFTTPQGWEDALLVLASSD